MKTIFRTSLFTLVLIGWGGWFLKPAAAFYHPMFANLYSDRDHLAVATPGTLHIYNRAPGTLTCQVTTNAAEHTVHLLPFKESRLHPSDLKAARIESVSCDGLKHHNLLVSNDPTTQDHFFIYQGTERHVLSILLYPYIPVINGNYSSIVHKIVDEFQKQHPTVSLNLLTTMDPQFDVYTTQNIPSILGKEGFDVAEIDSMLLTDYVKSGLINIPQNVSTSAFWPVAVDSATYDDVLYGVPSWICIEFVIGRHPGITSVKTWDDLDAYLALQPPHLVKLEGEFFNPLILTSFYIKAVADTYGYTALAKINYTQPDPRIMRVLAGLIDLCAQGQHNICNHTSFRNEVINFANDTTATYEGYSELSFFARLKNASLPLYGAILPFGPLTHSIFYSDMFLTSASRCNYALCTEAAKAFFDYMNRLETRRWIVNASDTPGSPPRRLLPSLKEFYVGKVVLEPDNIYKAVLNAAPFARPHPHILMRQREIFYQLLMKQLRF